MGEVSALRSSCGCGRGSWGHVRLRGGVRRTLVESPELNLLQLGNTCGTGSLGVGPSRILPKCPGPVSAPSASGAFKR
eukprot:1032252-Prymnesium_polylepis.1